MLFDFPNLLLSVFLSFPLTSKSQKMSPSKPSSSTIGLSNHAGSTRRKPDSSSSIKTTYLISYNLASALAWGYVLSLVVKHMSGQDGYTGLKEAAGVQGGLETLIKRASTAFDQSVPIPLCFLK